MDFKTAIEFSPPVWGLAAVQFALLLSGIRFPHVRRGLTDQPSRHCTRVDVFPTQAGIDRDALIDIALKTRFPHASGD